MKERRKALLTYLIPRTWAYLAGVFFLVVGIMCVAAGVPGALLICLILAGMVLFTPGRMIYYAFSNVRDLESRGLLEQALEEFGSGRSLAYDGLRLGEQFAFGKGTGAIVEYKDIVRLYERVHKTNFVEDERGLMMQMQHGGIFKLCPLPKGGLGKQEMLEIYLAFLVKNSEIKIGYK